MNFIKLSESRAILLQLINNCKWVNGIGDISNIIQSPETLIHIRNAIKAIDDAIAEELKAYNDRKFDVDAWRECTKKR